jgi:hypothetical protein
MLTHCENPKIYRNVLEFVIVITSFIFLLSPNNGFAKSTRSLRALRPLRLLATFRSTRKVLTALLGSFRQVFNVLVFGLLLWDVFAIVGVQFFQGRLVVPFNHSLQLMNPFMTENRSLTKVS